MKKGDLINVSVQCRVVAVGTEEDKDGKVVANVASVIPTAPIPSQFTVSVPVTSEPTPASTPTPTPTP